MRSLKQGVLLFNSLRSSTLGIGLTTYNYTRLKRNLTMTTNLNRQYTFVLSGGAGGTRGK